LLDLNTSLTNQLNSRSTRSLFLIRLYYGDESSFTGVSTSDFTDGSDFYKGVVSSMSDISYDLQFFGFKTLQNNISLRIINDKAFDSNKRFSDLVGTNSYDNRKFEIYVITNELSGLLTKEIICYGSIASDFNYDSKYITVNLTDFRASINTALPRTIIKEDDYTNDFHYAPEKNFNKPIPILYGDHSHTAAYDSGTISEETERWATRSKVPAVVINEFNTNGNKATAVCDTEAMHTMNASTAYLYNSGIYSALPSSNVSVTAADAEIKFASDTAYALLDLTPDSGTNSNYTRDKFLPTTLAATTSGTGANDLFLFGVPEVSNLGVIATNGVKGFVGGKVATTALEIQLEIDGTAATTNNAVAANNQRVLLTGGPSGTDHVMSYSTAQKDSWDFSSELTLVASTGNNGTVTVDSAFIQVEYTPNEGTSNIGFVEELQWTNPMETFKQRKPPVFDYVTVEKTFNFPKDLQVIYVSAKGRKYGSWVDGSRGSPGNSHNANDLIEHPVYVIESILRTEMGLADANINMVSFDTVAAATSSYRIAFSQLDRIKAFDLIDDICRQFCYYFFINGEGKATLVDKKLTTAYDPDSLSPDYSINFNDCEIGEIKKTDIGNVKTKIRIEYDYDYGPRINRLNVETSSPNNSTYNRDNSLDLVVDCNKMRYLVDSGSDANAKAVPTLIHNLYKDNHQTRKNVVSLTAFNPVYLKSEIGDIVSISNVPTEITLYGTAFDDQNFMITKISKSESIIKMDLTQVS